MGLIRRSYKCPTLDMAEKHYNRATGVSACNDFQSIVENIRKSQRCGDFAGLQPVDVAAFVGVQLLAAFLATFFFKWLLDE